ncbi:hypothetical protein ACFSTH_16175 [Paenibacillus yanchengensis]|uniref:Uncharacterized protein n=1 Tax=Paenibacillus yanchengensis TaxID=2035833 RepID=A0ABW4YGS6_9BACL
MKIRLTVIEYLGIIGLLIYFITIVVRRYEIIDNSNFNLFWFAPNFGGAWFTTALIKQFFSPVGTNKPISSIVFSIKSYAIICFGVVILAIINEYAYLLNTSGAFDIVDVIATIVAQILIFTLPIIRKEKCLVEYAE